MSKFGKNIKVKKFEVFGDDDEKELNKFLKKIDVVDIQSSAYQSMEWNSVLHVLVVYREFL